MAFENLPSPCGINASLDEAKAQIDALKTKIADGLNSVTDLGSIADAIKAKLSEVNVPQTPNINLMSELATLPYLTPDEYVAKIAELKRIFGDSVPELDAIIDKIPKPVGLSTSTSSLYEKLQNLAANITTTTQDILNALTPEAIAASITDMCKEVPNVEVDIVLDESGNPKTDANGKVVVTVPEVKATPPVTPQKNPTKETLPTAAPSGKFTFPFTKEKLMKAGGASAGVWYDAMVEVLPKYDITTPERVAAFIGNCRTETNWTALEENLNYGAKYLYENLNPKKIRFPTYEDALKVERQPEKIANIIYMVGRILIDPQPGDGWKYRGRGLIQLTFKDGYLKASKAIFGDDRLVTNPDIVAKDKSVAINSAAWYFKRTNVNAWADKQDWGNCRSITNAGRPGVDASKIHGYTEAVKNQQIAYDVLKA